MDFGKYVRKRKAIKQNTRRRRFPTVSRRSSSCNPSTTIIDPYTKRCLKLDMNGTIYNRYVLPFLLGNDSFLDAFSEKDRVKFELFLQKKHYCHGKKNIIVK